MPVGAILEREQVEWLDCTADNAKLGKQPALCLDLVPVAVDCQQVEQPRPRVVIVRIERQCPLERLPRRLRFLELEQHRAKRVPCIRKLGLKLDRPFEADHRLP